MLASKSFNFGTYCRDYSDKLTIDRTGHEIVRCSKKRTTRLHHFRKSQEAAAMSRWSCPAFVYSSAIQIYEYICK